jgi:hypothetical protein
MGRWPTLAAQLDPDARVLASPDGGLESLVTCSECREFLEPFMPQSDQEAA